MSTYLKKSQYKFFEFTSFQNAECSVDAEYHLPDYCPDIQKLLKCTADIQILSHTINDSKLYVQGNVNVTVLYTDEKGDSVRSCELTKEFTASAKLSEKSENIIAYLKVYCGRIICRAINARKLDIHIPVVICYALCSENEFEYVSEAFDCEKKEKSVKAAPVFKSLSKESSLSQNFELPASVKPIESIIRKEIKFINVKTLISDDNIDINADIEVSVVYRSYSSDSKIEKIKYVIPYNERIELTGLSDNNHALCSISKGELLIQAKEDSVGENTLLSLYAKFSINILIYSECELDYIEDVYSLESVSKESYEKRVFKTYSERKHSIEVNADITAENIAKVIDLWCDDIEIISINEQEKTNYRGKFNLNLLYYDSEDKVCFINKMLDFNSTAVWENKNTEKEITFAEIKSSEYRISGKNELKVNFSILTSALSEACESVNVLAESEIGEKYSDKEGRIHLVYKGGSLWEIAKEHKAAIKELMDINSITENEALQFPLMIYR